MTELERALEIAAKVAPDNNPESSCMLVASAIAGMRGLGLREIKIGSLFWPDKFKDDPYLSMRGGWGCEGYSDGRVFLSDETIDDDGGFRGHTWIEQGGKVIDVMHGEEGIDHEIHARDFTIVARYIRRPKLERAVKAHWRATMVKAIKLGAEQ